MPATRPPAPRGDGAPDASARPGVPAASARPDVPASPAQPGEPPAPTGPRAPERPMRADARRNRDAVLDASAELLASRPGASMQELADASGLGRATVYRHFATREDLVAALVARVADEVAEVVGRTLRSAADVGAARGEADAARGDAADVGAARSEADAARGDAADVGAARGEAATAGHGGAVDSGAARGVAAATLRQLAADGVALGARWRFLSAVTDRQAAADDVLVGVAGQYLEWVRAAQARGALVPGDPDWIAAGTRALIDAAVEADADPAWVGDALVRAFVADGDPREN